MIPVSAEPGRTAGLKTRGFTLALWQHEAVDAWTSGSGRPHRGTLEVVTGGGKTLIALACVEVVAETTPDLRVAVVVPTEALARQWVASITRHTTIDPADVGMLGAGKRASLDRHRVVVAVLNSAAKHLPSMAEAAQPLMLIVDECHRAGAPTFSRVLDTPAEYRLGLSATPDREELDADGEPLSYDEQRVGLSLGDVVYRFSLRDAREAGWLPDYDLHHHGLSLGQDERQRYDSISRQIDDMADRLRQQGIDPGSTRRQASALEGDQAQLAQAYVAQVARRKDLLYRAPERTRIAVRLVEDALQAGGRRVLLFHERVAEAEVIHGQLCERIGDRVALEHSRLPDRVRESALDAFRRGDVDVLVSVKSLIEGIDVPEADVGISVASTSSVRQRIQALGRVLRRPFDADERPEKHADMHLLYIADTVDELIYAKEDWSDLTGEGANSYWRWPLDEESGPTREPGPPARPCPTEDQELERLGAEFAGPAEPWLGMPIGHEYSVDVMGNVTNSFGVPIGNPQRVGDMVTAVRARPGGRFRVTPLHRFVLVWRADEERPVLYVAGRLPEPFVAEKVEPRPSDDGSGGPPAETELAPGDPYPGPAGTEGGTFKLSQKGGGVIQRKVAGGVEFALTANSGTPALEENARRVLDAWRLVVSHGMDFSVNAEGHAWYRAQGQRRFLANVPGGFAWPSDQDGGE